MNESDDGTRTFTIPKPDILGDTTLNVQVMGFIDRKGVYHEGYYDEEGVFHEGRPLEWTIAIQEANEKKAQEEAEEKQALAEAEAQREEEGEGKAGEAAGRSRPSTAATNDDEGEDKEGEGDGNELDPSNFVSSKLMDGDQEEEEYEYVDVGWAKRGKKRLKRNFEISNGDIPLFYGANREEQTKESVFTGFRTTEAVAPRVGVDGTRPSRFVPNADIAMPNEASVSVNGCRNLPAVLSMPTNRRRSLGSQPTLIGTTPSAFPLRTPILL